MIYLQSRSYLLLVTSSLLILSLLLSFTSYSCVLRMYSLRSVPRLDYAVLDDTGERVVCSADHSQINVRFWFLIFFSKNQLSLHLGPLLKNTWLRCLENLIWVGRVAKAKDEKIFLMKSEQLWGLLVTWITIFSCHPHFWSVNIWKMMRGRYWGVLSVFSNSTEKSHFSWRYWAVFEDYTATLK